jgi:hypothetical protein
MYADLTKYHNQELLKLLSERLETALRALYDC